MWLTRGLAGARGDGARSTHHTARPRACVLLCRQVCKMILKIDDVIKPQDVQ